MSHSNVLLDSWGICRYQPWPHRHLTSLIGQREGPGELLPGKAAEGPLQAWFFKKTLFVQQLPPHHKNRHAATEGEPRRLFGGHTHHTSPDAKGARRIGWGGTRIQTLLKGTCTYSSSRGETFLCPVTKAHFWTVLGTSHQMSGRSLKYPAEVKQVGFGHLLDR